ncbi:MAG: hypothetical protein M1497_05250 [Nitrospirae bacterium]|nr:hypothetical protein [Nitrospirota bacterium]
MDKISFLTRVAEVMKGMISYDAMMESIKRSCLRGEAKNLDLMGKEEGNVDRLIGGVTTIEEFRVSESVLDGLVLRYLRNTQFLANIKETEIDVSELGDSDLVFWKKTMLYKVSDAEIPVDGTRDI